MQESARLVDGPSDLCGALMAVLIAVLSGVATVVLMLAGVFAAFGYGAATSVAASVVHASPAAMTRPITVIGNMFLNWFVNWTNVIRPSRILAVWIFKTAHGRPD